MQVKILLELAAFTSLLVVRGKLYSVDQRGPIDNHRTQEFVVKEFRFKLYFFHKSSYYISLCSGSC